MTQPVPCIQGADGTVGPVDDKPVGGADEVVDEPSRDPVAGPDATADVTSDDVAADAQDAASAAEAEEAIVQLPWDEDLPVALGEDDEEAVTGAARRLSDLTSGGSGPSTGEDASSDDPDASGDADDDLGELYDDDRIAGRRNALPRRVESWRTRSASGAIATAIAMGLQQVFEPERRRPAAVAEAPSDPYADDDPVTVDYVPDDAEATRVHVKPWLLQKGDPT